MTEYICRMPSTFGYLNVEEALEELALPFDATAADAVTLDLSQLKFCDPVAAVAVAAFGAHYYRRTKERIRLEGWEPKSYLSRADVKKLWGYKDDWHLFRRRSNRLTSVIEVATAKDRSDASRQITRVLDIKDGAMADVVFYLLEEILRNVEEHADSPVNALLQAQYYEARDEVVFAIADTGRGILHSLRQRHPDLADHDAALRLAIQPGISGRNVRRLSRGNAGVGLTVTSRLVKILGGTFQIGTGDTVLTVTSREPLAHKLRRGTWPGVLVAMSIPRSETLDWDGAYQKALASVATLA